MTAKRVFTGTHRMLAEEATLQRLQPLLPRFGITRVANITGLDDVGIPTVVVTRPGSRSLSVSQGKGLNLVAAKVSGIMESIEQYCAEHIQCPLWLASHDDIRSMSEVVDVAALPCTSRRFDPHERGLWMLAASLGSARRVQVPFSMVTLDLRLPLPPGSGPFPMGSNGLASGNCLMEAIAHGLWELIERDALACFFAQPADAQSKRRLQLDSIESESARELLRRFKDAGVGVALWDMTSDLGVAAVFCSIVERALDPFRGVGVARGFGCHPDRDVALCRALCEAAQSRLTRISGSRDDLQREEVDSIRHPSLIERHQSQLEEPQHRDFRDVPTHQHPTFEADLDWAQQRLKGSGLRDVHYVDLSHRDLPVSIVRVIVPGLEGSPDVPGYKPGARALQRRGAST